MAPSAAAERELVGRQAELGAVEAFLDGLPERGSSLVLAGEAGIGKTVLWRQALALAEERGLRVLSAAVAETESAYAYAGLIDLFAGVGDEELTPTLRTALLRERGRARGEQVVALATLEAVVAFAAEAPVLLAIDDLQWLDQPSARVLGFVQRRVGAAPVGLLATVRREADTELDVDRLLADTGGARLEVAGLSLGALGRLLQARLGVKPSRPTLARLARATGGNPFYALEVARAPGFRAEGPGPLPVPKKLRDLVGDRVRALAPPAAEAVLGTYALARPTTADVVALCGEDALEEALSAEVLERHGERISLTHPLVGSSAYFDLSAAARRDLHERLASLPLDEEERVRHLALAAEGPSGVVAEALERAAGAARARGAPAGAAELLDMAVRLTPPDQRDDAMRRTLALAHDEYLSGQAGRGRLRCREVAAAAPPGHLRASALWARAIFRDADTSDEIEALLAQALRESEGDVELAANIHSAWTGLTLWAGCPNRGESHARTALECAERSGKDSQIAVAAALLAQVEFGLGRGIRTDLWERALALEDGLDESVPVYSLPSFSYAYVQATARDDVAFARACIRRASSAAAARGSEAGVALLALVACEFECVAGRLDEAERLATQSAALLEQAEVPRTDGYLLSVLAFVDACKGRAERARSRAQESLALDEAAGVLNTTSRAGIALGFLEISEGRPGDAVQHLAPVHERYLTGGIAEPSRYLPDLVEGLVALDRLDDAAATLEPFEQAARRLDRRWAIGAAARCRALLLATTGPADCARDAAAESVATLRDADLPLDLGRGLLVLGTIERRERRKSAAAEAIGEAIAIFEEIGAELWAEQARAELGRVGLRPRAPAELTATERRVAELAAAGHANEEIASLAHVSVKTVEANLTRVYRKLDIRSRHQLAERL